MVRTQGNDLKLAEGGCSNLSIQIGGIGVTSEGAGQLLSSCSLPQWAWASVHSLMSHRAVCQKCCHHVISDIWLEG